MVLYRVAVGLFVLVLSGVPGTAAWCAMACPGAAAAAPTCHEEAPQHANQLTSIRAVNHHHCDHDLTAYSFVPETKQTPTFSSGCLPMAIAAQLMPMASGQAPVNLSSRSAPPDPPLSSSVVLRI